MDDDGRRALADRPRVATLPSDFLGAYGFQWWVFTARGHPAYAAVGFGGQLVEVVPDLRLVAVTTVEVSDREMRLQHLTTMVADAVIPAMGG